MSSQCTYETFSHGTCSRDPIGYEGSENLYQYGSSTPLVRVDPSGNIDYETGEPTLNITDFDKKRCAEICSAQGKLVDRIIKASKTFYILGCWEHTQYFRTCVCKDRPDKNDRCYFEYMWCIDGVNRPLKPGERVKPWPKGVHECFNCYKQCKNTGKWKCKKPDKGVGPEMEDDVWPDYIPNPPRLK